MGDLIPVERLTRRDQLFRCEPLRTNLTAGTCIERQRAVAGVGRGPLAPAATLRMKYPGCALCPLGKAIAARVGEQIVERPSLPAGHWSIRARTRGGARG